MNRRRQTGIRRITVDKEELYIISHKRLSEERKEALYAGIQSINFNQGLSSVSQKATFRLAVENFNKGNYNRMFSYFDYILNLYSLLPVALAIITINIEAIEAHKKGIFDTKNLWHENENIRKVMQVEAMKAIVRNYQSKRNTK